MEHTERIRFGLKNNKIGGFSWVSPYKHMSICRPQSLDHFQISDINFVPQKICITKLKRIFLRRAESSERTSKQTDGQKVKKSDRDTEREHGHKTRSLLTGSIKNRKHTALALKIEKHLDSNGPSTRNEKFSCAMLRVAILPCLCDADDCFLVAIAVYI